MSRKVAREVAFKLIFENCFHKPEEGVTYEEFLNDFVKLSEINKESVFFEIKDKIDENDIEYIKGIHTGVLEHITEIVDMISSNLIGYTLDRLYKVDFAILIYCVYELKFTDTPDLVVINEGVELAKKFSDEKSPSFINGVLAKVLNDKG